MAAPDSQAQEAISKSGEQGYPLPEAQSVPGLPPGGGKLVLPHFETFNALQNNFARSYRWAYDEALRHSPDNAVAYRNDPVVMEPLRARQMGVAQLEWHVEPEDEQDDEQQACGKLLTEIIQAVPNFQRFRMHLLEAVWYGRYGIQYRLQYDYSRGDRRVVVPPWGQVPSYYPIDGDKIRFRWSGEAGVLVHAASGLPWIPTDHGPCHFFTPEERELVVVHEHEPEDAPYDQPDLAGAVHGVGIRGRLYWFLWLRAQILMFLYDFLERVGSNGIMVFFFEAANDASRIEMETAIKQWSGGSTLLVPRLRDGAYGPGVMRIEPSNAGAQMLMEIVMNYFDVVIRRFILGQDLSGQSGATGLGSGVADLQAETLNSIVKYDAVNLEETLTAQLVRVLHKYNCPHVPCPRFKFDVDKPNAQEHMEAVSQFYQLGGAVDEDSTRSILGLAKPKPGSPVLSMLDNMSPGAMGQGPPQGVPIVGEAGPAAGAGPPGPPGPPVPPPGQGPPDGRQTRWQNGMVAQMLRGGKMLRNGGKR